METSALSCLFLAFQHPNQLRPSPASAVTNHIPYLTITAKATAASSTTFSREKQNTAAKFKREDAANTAAVAEGPRNQSELIVAPPVPRNTFAVTVCNALDNIINTYVDGPPRYSVDPRHVLAGNFFPVSEHSPVPCPVIKGSIPPCLGGGAYIRNGPNPQYLPRGPHHLFDGDGMLHSILLPQGGGRQPATLSSRFVQTNKYKLERDAGATIFPNPFASFCGLPGLARAVIVAARTVTGQINPAQHGIGVANTNLFYFSNRLFALGESDLPYAVHVSPVTGEVRTIGRWDFDGKLFMGMTAHPKKDPVTGEVFGFRYSPMPPFLTYFWFDSDGKKQPDVPAFSLEQPSFMHDFAITKRHAVFADIQIVMKPMDMLLSATGSPVGTDSRKVSRIGILPRYASSEKDMLWFDVPGFNPIHLLNAWDEEGNEDTVVVVAPNVISVEHALEKIDLVHSCMEMVKIDTRDGTVTRTPLSAANLDFGMVNQNYIGRKNKFAYAGIGDPMPKISGVVKLDLEEMKKNKSSTECVVASRHYGPGCFGGEPFFAPSKTSSDEDDGYLVTFLHDEKDEKSKFLVMDAKSPSLEIVAEVLLPRRVPYGFHGIFVGEDDLREQKHAP